MTTETDSMKDDLAYVRAVAEGTRQAHVPAIYLIWAAICLCGFALVDIAGPASGWIGIYWVTAGPAGAVLSWLFARRAGARDGQADRRTGMRWVGHFLAFFGAGVLGLLLAATGEMSWPGVSSLWVLLLALTYFLAGLHLERRLMPVGLVFAAGYLLTLYLPDYRFTTVGVLVAVALGVQGLRGAREDRATD